MPGQSPNAVERWHVSNKVDEVSGQVDTVSSQADANTQSGAATDVSLVSHVAAISNPHSVTRVQLAAAAAADLASHEADTGNPHSVTAAQAVAWKIGSSVPANSAATAEDYTMVVDNDFIYVCKIAGWGSGGENWMRVAVAAF